MKSQSYFDELTDEDLLAYAKDRRPFTPAFTEALVKRFEDLLFDRELSSEPEHKDLSSI